MNKKPLEQIENVTDITGYRQVSLWKRQNLQHPQPDELAEEVPVALVYNGISHVVMMATPKDLAQFAVGFSLSEGIIENRGEIYGMDVLQACNGLEVQIELSSRRFMGLKERRRALAGRTGCGVCGVEHAAAWVRPSGDLAGGHEDVGRHVALDKLLGHRAESEGAWQNGAALVSSRASYEMVQKAAMCGVEILFAVSAATTLAVDVAERCNLTLVGFCKPGRATVYTHPQRLIAG